MGFDKSKMNTDRGFWEGPPETADEATSRLVAEYKANVCKNYISLNPEQIDTRLGGTTFWVTRKYDGELCVVFWEEGVLYTLNTSGRVRMGLPCFEEAAKALAKAGIKNAVIACELYQDESKQRARVFDTLQALADQGLQKSLKLAPFDIIRLDDWKQGSYGDTYQKLTDLFGEVAACKPVRCKQVDSKGSVHDLFTKWVEEEGSEGLVVRSELPLIYKVKPRYNVDVAVVGFSEGVAEFKGQVRSLLLALMPEEGVYQIVGKTGNGFGEELKKELLGKLTPMIIESKYIETDSNHVAFHMIKPELVIELNVNDVLFENTSGPLYNPQLEIVDGEYRRIGSVPGVSFVFPIFQRMREDKAVNETDVRLSQISDFMYNAAAEEHQAQGELSSSELLRREVYKKEQGDKLMVQKFLVWKTNKEQTGQWPAYVLNYVNFSSQRAEPLKTEIRISNSEEQILGFYQAFVDDNVKKGWVKVEA